MGGGEGVKHSDLITECLIVSDVKVGEDGRLLLPVPSWKLPLSLLLFPLQLPTLPPSRSTLLSSLNPPPPSGRSGMHGLKTQEVGWLPRPPLLLLRLLPTYPMSLPPLSSRRLPPSRLPPTSSLSLPSLKLNPSTQASVFLAT